MAFDFPSAPSTGQVYQPAGGPSWQWDGAVWKSYQTSGEMALARTFIPGGAALVTYNYSKPANLRYLEFEGVAAGGSAGGSAAASASTFGYASSGGGGAWGKKLFTAAALPTSVTVSIGAPGAGVSASNGNSAAATTFGSLITLPGGLRGSLGTNVAYTSWNTVSGSGYTADPTGVDVGSAGESSGFPVVGVAAGSSPGTVLAHPGIAGGSPWGKAFAPQWCGAAGLVSYAGTGYGWGSTGPISSGGQAARASLAGGPGAVLLTEYLAVAPADVVTPLRQTFYPTGATLLIPVPPTAKHARISGHVYSTTVGGMGPAIRLSLDGSTIISGAADYIWGGNTLYTGTSGNPTKSIPITASNWPLGGYTNRMDTAVFLDVDVITQKTAGGQMFNYRARVWAYHDAATAMWQEAFWAGYTNLPALSAASQIAAIQIFNIVSAAQFAANSVLTVEWTY